MQLFNKPILIFYFCIAFALLSGCSNLKSYSTDLSNNLLITLDKNSDSGVEGRVDIYLLDKQCNGPYQGSKWIGKKSGNAGLKVDSQTLLKFNFLISDWLKGKHSNAMSALIKPRVGYRYDAKMSYIDNAFDIEIFEVNRKTRKRRSIDIIGLNSCK